MSIKVVIYDGGKYLIKRHETALYPTMLFEEILG